MLRESFEMTSFIAERTEEGGRGRRAASNDSMVVAKRRRVRKAQSGKLSGRGDAISAAKEGRRTGKEGGRPKQAAHQVSTGRKAQAAPSFPRVCRTKSSKQDGAQAGVAVRSSAA